MQKEPKYMVVDSTILPDVFSKVMEAKRYLSTAKASSASEASRMAGISRSAFYKYKDHVFPLGKNLTGRMLSVNFMLKDKPGVLAKVISVFYETGCNILTIHQNIPVNGVAPVSISANIDGIAVSVDDLLARLRTIEGVKSIVQVSGEVGGEYD